MKAGGASLSIEDCIGSGQIGKSGFGFWGVNEDAIRDLAENDSLTQGDMLSTLIGSGGLFEEHFGAHKSLLIINILKMLSGTYGIPTNPKK